MSPLSLSRCLDALSLLRSVRQGIENGTLVYHILVTVRRLAYESVVSVHDRAGGGDAVKQQAGPLSNPSRRQSRDGFFGSWGLRIGPSLKIEFVGFRRREVSQPPAATFTCCCGGTVDTRVSDACVRKGVRVQISPTARTGKQGRPLEAG